MYYEVSLSNVHSISPQCVVRQTKIFANVHYIPICQISCSPLYTVYIYGRLSYHLLYNYYSYEFIKYGFAMSPIPSLSYCKFAKGSLAITL